jgi:hypothetical protein
MIREISQKVGALTALTSALSCTFEAFRQGRNFVPYAAPSRRHSERAAARLCQELEAALSVEMVEDGDVNGGEFLKASHTLAAEHR